MENFFINYALFLAKTITAVIATIIVFGSILGITMKNKLKDNDDLGKIKIKNLSEYYKKLKHKLLESLDDKQEIKNLKKQEKLKNKKNKDLNINQKNRIFVIDFDGDMKASDVSLLKQKINSILLLANTTDEVLLRLESPGGMAHAYGLAACELARLRERNIKLTIAVDKVAASGGYMMACVANKIISSPFAIIGSIGVVAQIPNFNRLLEKHDIDFEQFTAGQYKRTVTMFGKNTKEGRKKFQEDLEEMHVLFKQFIEKYRPQLDVNKVATGEHWFGEDALKLNLVDSLETSDNYLLDLCKDNNVFLINCAKKEKLAQKLSQSISLVLAEVSSFFAK